MRSKFAQQFRFARVSVSVLLALVAFGAVGCSLTAQDSISGTKDATNDIREEKNLANSAGDLADLYILVLDKIYQTDPGLNEDIAYIAVDPASLEGLAEKDKMRVIAYFKKYHQHVLSAGLPELEQKEKQDNLIALQGVLLSLEKVEQKSDGKWLISARKFRSLLGAVGMTYLAGYENGKWNLQEYGDPWMALHFPRIDETNYSARNSSS